MVQTAKHVIFRGRVQGVGFRFTSYNTAKRHDLTGLVRNLPDGTVEIIAQGDINAITDCIQDLKKHFGSDISEIKIEESPVNPEYGDFKITF